ncbi:hypothetical protein [Campylobacter lanienae]|uniref:DUF2846 domain-containing protein n=1 Tax=Campylobacter lanienae NCTC 13004 TaxID=1031753 RepID=A0A1X9SLY9_9BACT|nr:hypothetical protein [Campylobacter lanienae]ARQ97244.1 hypothetical protein CLAN_0489 [Campylobacter lanienae NCTC 13004]
MYLNKSFAVLTITAITIIFTGCGAKGAYFDKFEQPADGNASIYIYRPTAFYGGGIRYNAILNDGEEERVIGLISNGSYLYTQVFANREIEIKTDTMAEGSITIDTENQKIYCMRSTVAMSIMTAATIEQVDMETCQKEIINTQLHE